MKSPITLFLLLLLFSACKQADKDSYFVVTESLFTESDTVHTSITKSTIEMCNKLLSERSPVPDIKNMFERYRIEIKLDGRATSWRYHDAGYIQEISDTASSVYKLKNVEELNKLLLQPYIQTTNSTLSEITNYKTDKKLSEEERFLREGAQLYQKKMSLSDKITFGQIVHISPNIQDSIKRYAGTEYFGFTKNPLLQKYAFYSFMYNMTTMGPDSTTYQFFDSIDTHFLSQLIVDAHSFSESRIKQNKEFLILRRNFIPQTYVDAGVKVVRVFKSNVEFRFHSTPETRTSLVVSLDEDGSCKSVTAYYNSDVHQQIYPILKPLESKRKFRAIVDNIKGNQQLPLNGKK